MGDGILGEKMRLDKLLALLGEGTRSEIKAMVRAGRVTVGGRIVTDTDGAIPGFDGVFSGGDCQTGPSTVIRAINAGKVAAANITGMR